MQKIKDYFDSLVKLNDEEWKDFSAYFERVEVQKLELILKEGQICDYIAFIESGIFRFYHLKEGNEKVTAFWFEGDFLSNYRSFISAQPSEHYIEAMDNGIIWRLKREDLNPLYNKHHTIERLGRRIAEQLYLMVSHRLDNFLFNTPEERYLSLLQKGSRLIQEIPQYMLASYLGVSPESISRIRKRITL